MNTPLLMILLLLASCSQDLLLTNGAVATNAISCSCSTADSATFGSNATGDSETDPFVICSRTHLERLHTQFATNSGWSGKYFKQCSDIDLGGMSTPFIPIGLNDSTYSFSGNYDGNDYDIENFYYSDNSQDNVGFFSVTSGATIKKISLTNGLVDGQDNVGILAGTADNSTILQSNYVSGTLSFTDIWYMRGGMVGNLDHGSIIDSSTSDVHITSSRIAGGLVGWVQNGAVVRNSLATGNVTTSNSSGGLAAYVYNNGQIHNSRATGVVISNDTSGGITAWLENGSLITNSTATGNITGDNCAGGVVGFIADSTVRNSHYTTGIVEDNNYAGGISCELDEGIIENSSVTGTIKTAGGTIGGISPYISGTAPVIRNSSFSGQIIAPTGYVGLIAGDMDAGLLDKNTVTGTYSGEAIAGLVAWMSAGAQATNNIVMGSITGTTEAAGLTLAANNSITQFNIIATKLISAPSSAIDLLVVVGGTHSDNFYWNSGTINGDTPSLPGVAPVAGYSPLTGVQMQAPGSFSGFDFAGTWEMSSTGYLFPRIQE